MSYQSVILADSPVGYWPLDETSGTVAHDLSGNGYNGTYQGTYTLGSPPLVAGVPSVLMGGHGTGSLVDVGDIAALVNMPASWSLECWFKTTSVGSGNYQGLFAGYVGGLCMRLNGSGLDILLDQEALLYTIATNFAIGVIYCLHVTYDNTTFRIYINGALFSSYSSAGQGFGGSNQTLGADPGVSGHDSFGGNLGQMAMYNTVLTPAQILNHYNAGNAAPVSPGSPLYTGGGTDAQFLLLQR
jgi:hypothetical protein